jgi:hypothetical protein
MDCLVSYFFGGGGGGGGAGLTFVGGAGFTFTPSLKL